MNYADEIKNLRERIAARQSEHRELTEQVRSRAEVGEYVGRVVTRLEDGATLATRRALQALAYGYAPLMEANVVEGAGIVPSVAELGEMLTLMVGAEHVKSALLKHLDSVPEGLPAAQRAARLAQITAELEELEAREEDLICQAEDAREFVLRRADARPEIVLALPRKLG